MFLRHLHIDVIRQHPDLALAAREYAQLELAVKALIVKHTGACARCTTCCCRTDICTEGRDSPWLNMVRELTPQDEPAVFSELYGWLRPTGCGLSVGRPPICHEFFCTPLWRGYGPDAKVDLEGSRKVLSVVGRNAYGGRHLITLTADQLLRMNAARLRRKIAEAMSGISKLVS